MSKPILILILVASISLIAMAAHADPEGPAFGQDPNAEPPRSGVGNANSGNHEMHLENQRKRWNYGDNSTDSVDGPRQVDGTFEPTYLSYVGQFITWSRFLDLVVLR